MRDPVQIHLQLDQRWIRVLEDDVVSDLPVLLDELEVVIVVGQLEPGLPDLRPNDVQTLSDDFELLDCSIARVEQGPRDVCLTEGMGAFDAAVDVSFHVVRTGRREPIQIVVAAGGREFVVSQALCERLGWKPVVADPLRVEAVGLDLFVPQTGNVLQRAVDVTCQCGAYRVELQAHLVARACLGKRSREGSRRECASLLHERSSADHGVAKSTRHESLDPATHLGRLEAICSAA